MGFSDEDRILMGKCVSFKGYGANKNLLRNFWIKVGDCGDWTKFRKSCKKLAPLQDEAAALKAYRISCVFLSRNIHT